MLVFLEEIELKSFISLFFHSLIVRNYVIYYFPPIAISLLPQLGLSCGKSPGNISACHIGIGWHNLIWAVANFKDLTLTLPNEGTSSLDLPFLFLLPTVSALPHMRKWIKINLQSTSVHTNNKSWKKIKNQTDMEWDFSSKWKCYPPYPFYSW